MNQTNNKTDAVTCQAGDMQNRSQRTLRERSARGLLAVASIALLLGIISLPSIGVFIVSGTLPLFVTGLLLHRSRVHVAIGITGALAATAGLGLLVYLLVVGI